jgi:hypothetical protein
VTAEEIRLMAQELEDALGGVYTVLTQEFQLPYLNRYIAVMQSASQLPALPKSVGVSIVTGLEALGRGHDRNRLVGWITTITQTLGPNAAARRINDGEFMNRLAVADQIDTDNLLLDDDTVAANDQAQAEAAQAAAITPEVVKQGGAALQQAVQQQEGA